MPGPRSAISTAVNARTEVTDRSIPRTMRTRNCPTVTIPMNDACRAVFRRLTGSKNKGVQIAATTSSAISATTTP